LTAFMVIYLFDICCSARYSFIYLRFKTYARYHSMGDRLREQRRDQVKTSKNLQYDTLHDASVVHVTSANLKAFQRQRRVNGKQIHKRSTSREQTMSMMSRKLSGSELITAQNINVHDDNIDAVLSLKARRSRTFKKRAKKHKEEAHGQFPLYPPGPIAIPQGINVAVYGSRHYSFFEPDDNMLGSDRTRKRFRSRSEADSFREFVNSKGSLPHPRTQSIATTVTVTPPKVNGSTVTTDTDHSEDDPKASLIMDLREKVNFLKATLFAKQSMLDRFKLDLSQREFEISNLSLKVKNLEREKEKLEQELLQKNEDSEEKGLQLQVAEDTINQLTNEKERLRRKLTNRTPHVTPVTSHSKSGHHSGFNMSPSMKSLKM